MVSRMTSDRCGPRVRSSRMQSMTASAPIDLTRPTFLVLHAPVISAPGHFGDLHRERADAARRAVDQDLLPGPHPGLVPQRLQGGDRGNRNGCGLLEGDHRRLRDDLVARHARPPARCPGHRRGFRQVALLSRYHSPGLCSRLAWLHMWVSRESSVAIREHANLATDPGYARLAPGTPALAIGRDSSLCS